MALILAGGHEVSTKPNLLASFSHTPFSLMGWNLMYCSTNASWTSWDYFWMRCIGSREAIANLLTAFKNVNTGMHLDVCKPIQGKRFLSKLELAQSLCCKVAWSSSLQWLIMFGRWLQRNPVSMASMDLLSICSFCFSCLAVWYCNL